MPSPIRDILKPRSVAIIGASKDPAKRGYRAIQALFRQGFEGMIIPINPKESEILGLPCYSSLAAVPHAIDTALVCTPARAAPGVIGECGEKGVKGAVLLAGGFGESGVEGAELEARTIEVAKRHGVRLIGPNTNGIFDAHTGLNLVGWPGIYKGGIGVLSQSGNVAMSLMTASIRNGQAGFTTFVGVGNESDISFAEYLRYFGEDAETRSVIVYAEGFEDGAAFVEAAREVTARKPVVLYKAGRTQQGEGAARSHSGSLAGDYAVGKGVMRQAGIVVVERSDEMFPVAEALSHHAGKTALRVGILSEGGGVISQAVDALAERGLTMPRLEPESEAALKATTPNASQLYNPVDYGGATDPHPRYLGPCTRAILSDPNIDAMLSVGYVGGYQCRNDTDEIREAENAAAREMAAISQETGKPIIVQNHYAEWNTEAMRILRDAGIVVVRSIEVAAACLAGIEEYHRARQRVSAPPPPPAATEEARAIIAAARAEGRSALLEPEALRLLAASGIAVPPFAVLREGEAPPAALTEVPVAIKIVSRDILHKSDVGGVRLNLSGAPAITEGAAAMRAAVAARQPDARLEGVLVTPMAPRGVEIILGVTTDPQYGKVMLFGLGGVFVEVLKDVTFRRLPLGRGDAEAMLDEIKGSAILDGVRGGAGVDRDAILALMLQLSGLALAHPGISEIDLNPVIAGPAGATIADARILLA
ncbi:acetate--CoA ligase family protein [Roseomonas populi]|uniref:Acetate--CoA ligase family protein n=1 Tax=Roseomonas populi TaxID=3121582 RepID=A0ABT1X8P6_9PROT|nr:acetate--CoA ligase family protein [Roseomonas pecuniae]MCR0983763.1 acetate--CoA ligase family protein [Roseomonas pecuniae]